MGFAVRALAACHTSAGLSGTCGGLSCGYGASARCFQDLTDESTNKSKHDYYYKRAAQLNDEKHLGPVKEGVNSAGLKRNKFVCLE